MATPAPYPAGSTISSEVSSCALAWIKYVLCGNPILNGLIISTLTGLIATLEAETTVLIIEAGRLNILAQITQIEMGALNAIVNKTQSELNLILGPLASTSCLDLQNLIGKLQNSATGKVLIAIQNYIYKYSKYSSLYQAKLAQIAQNNQLVTWCNNFIAAINQICGS